MDGLQRWLRLTSEDGREEGGEEKGEET